MYFGKKNFDQNKIITKQLQENPRLAKLKENIQRETNEQFNALSKTVIKCIVKLNIPNNKFID